MENRYHGQWIVPLSHCDETGRLSVQGALGEFMMRSPVTMPPSPSSMR